MKPLIDPEALQAELAAIEGEAIGWQPLGWSEWFRAQGTVWAKALSIAAAR